MIILEYFHPSHHASCWWCSYGYDPLGLGKDTATVEKYRAYELIHARWAMLAAAGIIIPEGLQVSNPQYPSPGSSHSSELYKIRRMCFFANDGATAAWFVK